jgi:hypothetical protein
MRTVRYQGSERTSRAAIIRMRRHSGIRPSAYAQHLSIPQESRIRAIRATAESADSAVNYSTNHQYFEIQTNGDSIASYKREFYQVPSSGGCHSPSAGSIEEDVGIAFVFVMEGCPAITVTSAPSDQVTVTVPQATFTIEDLVELPDILARQASRMVSDRLLRSLQDGQATPSTGMFVDELDDRLIIGPYSV